MTRVLTPYQVADGLAKGDERPASCPKQIQLGIEIEILYEYIDHARKMTRLVDQFIDSHDSRKACR